MLHRAMESDSGWIADGHGELLLLALGCRGRFFSGEIPASGAERAWLVAPGVCECAECRRGTDASSALAKKAPKPRLCGTGACAKLRLGPVAKRRSADGAKLSSGTRQGEDADSPRATEAEQALRCAARAVEAGPAT